MNAPAEACEVYVYYRVPRSQQQTAANDVAALQRALGQQLAGLTCRFLIRADDGPATDGSGPSTCTCMEIYRHPEGLSAAAQALIDAQGTPWPTARIGPRHVERFVPIDPV